MNKQRSLIIAVVAVFALIISCSTASADTRLFGTFGAGSFSEMNYYDDPYTNLYYHSGYDGFGLLSGDRMYGGDWAKIQKTVYFNKNCNVDVKVHSSWSGAAGSNYLRLYIDGSPVGSDFLLTGFYHTWTDVSFQEGNRVVVLQRGRTGSPISSNYYSINHHWEFSDLTLLNDTSLVYGVVTDQDSAVIQGVTVTVGGYDVTTDSSGYYQVIVNDSDTYSVSASKTGYSSYSGSVTVVTSDVEKNIQLDGIKTLSGYVTNNLNNSVSGASITLNNSGGSDTTDSSGYYEITEIPSGTYSITATSPTHQDYSDTVSITANTEKNITMTRLTPALSNVGIIDSSESTLRIGWKENAVVDSVRIYQGTNTNLIATEDTSYVSLASYTVENLDADTGYNFWLEPWDGSVSGIKYYVSGTTDGDGGGGGGGGGDPTPTATGTPGPTAPPYTNITDEDWLNLTRYEQEYILFEHDTLNVTMGTYTPKPVNVSFWFLVLIAGILSTIYGAQKKEGELFFSIGLAAAVISMIKLGLF